MKSQVERRAERVLENELETSNFKLQTSNLKPQTSNFKLQTSNFKLRERGFTMLELVIVIAIYSVLIGVLLDRLNYYQELAEKAAMESTLRTIKTGLQIRLAELIVTNRQAEAASLEAEDPIKWLDQKPANYAGNYREPPERGAWYFDPGEGELVYVVNNGSRLELDAASRAKQIRFRARLLKDKIPFGGATIESVTGVTLAPVVPYRWSGAENRGILARVLQPYQRDANAIS